MPICILYRHAVKFKTTLKIFYPLKLYISIRTKPFVPPTSFITFIKDISPPPPITFLPCKQAENNISHFFF